MDNETRNEELEIQETAKAPAQEKTSRRHMSEESKKRMIEKRNATKQLADNLVPDVYVQYQDWEHSVAEIVEDAKSAFRQEKKRAYITSMKVYIKPEERAAYYVINDKTGKLEY